MNFNVQELTLIRNVLWARRAYRITDVSLGAKPWEDWMEPFLSKVENAIQNQS